MIYHISGELAVVDMTYAVIDCGGVGYKLYITGNTLGKLAGRIGEKVRLFTFMKVLEDAVDLYGFWDNEELDIFKMLISVSGVGAKSAVSILSLMTPQKFAMAVAQGDAKAISKAQGIGSKTAQRVILELKDKIAKGIAVGDEEAILTVDTQEGTSKRADAIDTLLVLGYTRREAEAALGGIDLSAMELEDIIRAALKKLVRN